MLQWTLAGKRRVGRMSVSAERGNGDISPVNRVADPAVRARLGPEQRKAD